MAANRPDNAITEAKSWRAEAFRRLRNERPDFFEQVTNYCLLGATEQQLGEFFGFDRETWLYWLKHSQELRDAVDQGGTLADAEVAAGIYRRAKGYEYTRQKLLVSKDGVGQVYDLTEHVPPDTAAGKFWLTNRAGNRWSDSKKHEHSGEVAVDQNITIEFIGATSSGPMIDVTPKTISNDDLVDPPSQQ